MLLGAPRTFWACFFTNRDFKDWGKAVSLPRERNWWGETLLVIWWIYGTSCTQSSIFEDERCHRLRNSATRRIPSSNDSSKYGDVLFRQRPQSISVCAVCFWFFNELTGHLVVRKIHLTAHSICWINHKTWLAFQSKVWGTAQPKYNEPS